MAFWSGNSVFMNLSFLSTQLLVWVWRTIIGYPKQPSSFKKAESLPLRERTNFFFFFLESLPLGRFNHVGNWFLFTCWLWQMEDSLTFSDSPPMEQSVLALHLNLHWLMMFWPIEYVEVMLCQLWALHLRGPAPTDLACWNTKAPCGKSGCPETARLWEAGGTRVSGGWVAK